MILLLGVTAQGAGQQIIYPREYFTKIELAPSALSEYHFPISSANPDAQAYFDQGMQLHFSFAKLDAARSFRQAQLTDPQCAMCFWGEALAWGPNLNGPMTVRESSRANHAISEAIRLSGQASRKEAELIEALSLRYVADYSFEFAEHQDRAYTLAMADLANDYSDDIDIASLYSEALYLLTPRPGVAFFGTPQYQGIKESLEGTLQNGPHIGACHLYIHLVATTSDAPLALDCARSLADSLPGVSHMLHMPTHLWTKFGMWDEAVQSSVAAVAVDQDKDSPAAFSSMPHHNLQMLNFAAAMDGQQALALSASQGLGELTGSFIPHFLTLIRFGRFDEIDPNAPLPESPTEIGIGLFVQGYAALKKGNPELADRYANLLAVRMQSSGDRYRGIDSQLVLSSLHELLEGEIHMAKGETQLAIQHFVHSTEYYDRFNHTEPEAFPFTPRHWLGSAYLESEAFELAEDVFRTELLQHPNSGWTLFGLMQALEGSGQTKAFKDVERLFAEAWSRSDLELHSVKF